MRRQLRLSVGAAPSRNRRLSPGPPLGSVVPAAQPGLLGRRPSPELEQDLRDHRLMADLPVKAGEVNKIRPRAHANLGGECGVEVCR